MIARTRLGPALVLGFLLALMTLASPRVAAEGPVDPGGEEAPRRSFAWGAERPPHLPGPAPDGALPDAVTEDIVPWSKLVFESYRDGNWEIYRSDPQGGSPVRLTADDAVDIEPHLNPGCTAVAFASDRDGNPEIYTMRVDGAGPTRRTYEEAADYGPAWSPDGTRFVFTSERYGLPDIFVMNVDGSNVVRLTDHPDVDMQPSWSPDGTRIAFTSRRTGGYRIWVMNADGTGQTQLSAQPYSEHPVWSPDGLSIGYDADGDSDGWQELWVTQADGSSQHRVYKPMNPRIDYWFGSWSADGRFIGYTEIYWQYDYGYGFWVWTKATPYAIDASNPWQEIRLASTGLDWSPDWETTDTAAPRSAMWALPALSRRQAVVRFSGTDAGPAGVLGYDVQVRQGPVGEWTDWLVRTPETYGVFTGEPGHTYAFRSRAVDNAFNWEAWPEEGAEAETTLYHWATTGTVVDNRGAPVVAAEVDTGPPAMEGHPSDGEGRFAATVGQAAETYAVTWNKVAYGALPATVFESRWDAEIGVTLPPADNVLLNGGFESPADPLAGWSVSGGVPAVVTTEVRYLGSCSIEAGPSCAAPCLGGRTVLAVGEQPDVSVDSEGVAHVVWSDVSVGVMHSARLPDGTWTTPEAIYEGGLAGGGGAPRIAVDGLDTLHVVYYGWNGPRYTQRPAGGGWSTPVGLPAGGGHTIAADGSGGVHVLYKDAATFGDIHYLWRTPGGAWQAPVYVAGSYDGSNIAVGPGGEVHLLWQESYVAVYHRTRYPDGTWSPRWTVDPDQHRADSRLQLVVGPDGELHAVWQSSGVGKYAHRPPGGSWSEPITLPSADGAAMLAIDWQGVLHMIEWSHYDEYADYRQRRPDGTWTTPVDLVGWGVGRKAMAIGLDGLPHIVIGSSAGKVCYVTRDAADWPGDALLSQAVTLPETLHAPTLSLAVARIGATPGAESRVWAAVNHGGTTTELDLHWAGGPWAREWADLSPYAGETVTVTVGVNQWMGEPNVRVYLDQVSVGSAHPDLWVDLHGSRSAAPGEPVVYRIDYGNRGGVDAPGVAITGTLPAGLMLVGASPPPTATAPALVWDVGMLPAGGGPSQILITATVAITVTPVVELTSAVEIGSAEPEIETANNEATQTTIIGWVIYAPLVMRR